MAQRRKSVARRKPAKPRLSDVIFAATQRFMVNRLFDLAGIALVALSVACFLALVSHNPHDPSFTVATSKAPLNVGLQPSGAGPTGEIWSVTPCGTPATRPAKAAIAAMMVAVNFILTDGDQKLVSDEARGSDDGGRRRRQCG